MMPSRRNEDDDGHWRRSPLFLRQIEIDGESQSGNEIKRQARDLAIRNHANLQ
jgi:hypothetical protein